jgi:hypothetical protein
MGRVDLTAGCGAAGAGLSVGPRVVLFRMGRRVIGQNSSFTPCG